ncbi:MAG: SUMF1/EgtB/PvdO family nonheme iron enzyme [Salinivirgaceae bacterium]|nr:SUMF1/EgtB/PvdO family nonheme iron enzyme [Salinivirgaceae bacterium]
MLQENTIIDNHYELKRQLGRGSFGEVWLAIDTYLQQEVALKFYVAMDDNGRSEFRDEYRKVFRLRHENLLTPSHYAEWNGQPYLELEYCPTSAAALAGKISESELWLFIADVAAGLAYMHGSNPTIVHQDIKPANILRKTDGHFAITDFGISVSLRSTMLRQSGRDVTGSVGGSIPYMGPELFGAKPVPVMASDIWALGVTIYEMATGELPFMGQGGVMLKNGAELPILDDFSAELNQMMQSCLALNTWDRPTADTIAKQAVAYSSKVPPVKPQKPAAKPKAEYDNSATQKMSTTAPTEPTPEVTPRTFETKVQMPRPQTLNDAYKNSEQPKPHTTPRTPNGNGENQNKAGCILFIIIMLIVGGIGIAGYLKVEEYNGYVSSFNYNLERATVEDARELDQHYVGHVVTGPLVDAQWCIKQINILKSGFWGFLMNSPNDNFQRRYDARCAELKATLYLSKTTVTDDGKGGNFKVKVSTNAYDYDVKSDQNWCKVEQESILDRLEREQNEKSDSELRSLMGAPNTYYFKVKIDANPTTNTRTATVTVSTTYKTETISVTQKPKAQAKNTNNNNGVSSSNSTNTNSNNSVNTSNNNVNTGNRSNSTANNSSSSNIAAAHGPNDIYVSEYGYIEMVYVEGGTFKMGATSEQGTDAFADEKPAHNVTLRSYYIGKYEVTQGLWKAIMGINPTKGDKYPVVNVSWEKCQEFIRKLNQVTGKNFRLPTEAEWEYAARGGKKSNRYKYAGGNYLSIVAWYGENANKTIHSVGQKLPNELGIYDMSGNVWEWCSDWMGNYSSYSQTNPTGPATGSEHVVRGGSYSHIAKYARVSYRNKSFTPSRGTCGLRLVMDK